MGSVGFDGEDESQPSTSNGNKYKLPRTLLDECGAVNYASVPRKLRSAIKKRGRESITSPLPISRKPSNGVETLRKDSAKKSKLNMKKHGRISKDEEEVAQTLYALADLFSDANKASQQESDNEPPQTKSSAIPEDSTKISSKITAEATCYSSIMEDSTNQVLKIQSLSDIQEPHLPSIKQPAKPSRPEIDLEQEAHGIQSFENYHPLNERYNNICLSSNTLSATGARFDSRNCASQPNNIINAEKNTHEPKKSWKKCSAHVYVCRLIKVLQISEIKEALLEKSTQVTELRRHLGPPTHTVQKDSAQFQNDIILHERAVQDTGTCSSANQGYDFLSLGSNEAPRQFHMSYVQPQNQSPLLFSASQNGYSTNFQSHNSSLAAQQVQQYLGSTGNSSFTQQQLQQKWANQYNSGPHLAEWRNGGRDTSASMLNYAHSIFPHLHSALGSKYQQIATQQQQQHHHQQQQQQIMAMNSLSNVKRNHHHHHHHNHLSLAFERNGNAFYSENVPQLHQHL